jgi:hypothetical protein
MEMHTPLAYSSVEGLNQLLLFILPRVHWIKSVINFIKLHLIWTEYVVNIKLSLPALYFEPHLVTFQAIYDACRWWGNTERNSHLENWGDGRCHYDQH